MRRGHRCLLLQWYSMPQQQDIPYVLQHLSNRLWKTQAQVFIHLGQDHGTWCSMEHSERSLQPDHNRGCWEVPKARDPHHLLRAWDADRLLLCPLWHRCKPSQVYLRRCVKPSSDSWWIRTSFGGRWIFNHFRRSLTTIHAWGQVRQVHFTTKDPWVPCYPLWRWCLWEVLPCYPEWQHFPVL